MLPRIVSRFRHKSGAVCIMTVEEQPKGCRVTWSFRDHRGFAPAQVMGWADQWNAWTKALTQGVFWPVPDGWQ